MGDKRFEARIKRVNRRARANAGPEVLAGVGDLRQAQSTALALGKPRASLILALVGGVLGALASDVLRMQLGYAAFATLPTDMLLDILRSEPMIGAASGFLAVCVLMAVFSFLRGRRAAAMMSFSGAALGGGLAPVLLFSA